MKTTNTWFVLATSLFVAISHKAYSAPTICKQDSFDTYADGSLDGLNSCTLNVCAGGPNNGQTCGVNGDCTTVNGGWVKSPGATGISSQIAVHNHAVQFLFNNTGTDKADTSDTWTVGCVQCAVDQTVTVTFAIKRNSATVGANGNEWQISFFEPTGKQLGQWRGSPTNATPRINGAGTSPTTSVTLTPDQFDTLRIVFQMGIRRTDFYWTPFGLSESPIGTILWSTQTAANQLPAGTNTLDRIVFTNLNRESVSNGDITIDNLVTSTADCSCSSSVSPLTSDTLDNFISAGLVGGAAFPPSLPYTLSNNSPALAISYSASESNADGTAHDFPWMSVSPATGGPIGAGASTPTLATLTPPGTPGIYSGNVKVTDSCGSPNNSVRPVVLVVGAAPCFVDPIEYPNGELAPNGAWVTTGGVGAIVVSGGAIQVNVDSAGGGGNVASTIDTHIFDDGNLPTSQRGCHPCEDGTITAIARVKGAPSSGGNSWALFFDDASGANLATWYGTSAGVTPRINGMVPGLPGATLSTSSFDELKVVVDTIHHTTQFFQNGTSLGTASHGVEITSGQTAASGILSSISIQRIGRGGSGEVNGNPTIDSLEVLGCTGTCFAYVKPKPGSTSLPYASNGGAAAIGAPIDITTINEGLEPFSYSAQTVDANGSPFTYPWLSLLTPTGGPLSVASGLGAGDEGTGDVTAVIDTTGLPKGAQRGFVKVTSTCNPAQSYIRDIVLNVDNVITENFNSFSNGDLALKSGWFTSTPLGVPSPIQVLGNAVKITGGTLTKNIDVQHLTFQKGSGCDDTDPNTAGRQTDTLVSVKVKIRGHNGGSSLWQLHCTNTSLSTDIASWSGSASSVTPFTSGGSGNAQPLTGGGVYDQLEAKINFNTNTVDGIPGDSTRFYFNGTPVATLNGVPDDGYVRNIRFVQLANNFTGDSDPSIEFDDLVISRCVPGCHDPVFDVRTAQNNVGSDGLIDEHDLQAFEFCTGTSTGSAHGHSPTLIPNPNLSILECSCMDVNHDQQIDINDFAVFQRCYTGASGTIDPNCDN